MSSHELMMPALVGNKSGLPLDSHWQANGESPASSKLPLFKFNFKHYVISILSASEMQATKKPCKFSTESQLLDAEQYLEKTR